MNDENVNVTATMLVEIQRALFAILPEEIRIRDLEESSELQETMTALFADEKLPTTPGWPYLDQLEAQQDCLAAKGCKFKLGSALYKASSCDHYLCTKHKKASCCPIKTQPSKQVEEQGSSRASEQPPDGKTREAPIMDGNEADKNKADKSKTDKSQADKDKVEEKRGNDTKPTSDSEQGVNGGTGTIESKVKRGKERTVMFEVETVGNLVVGDFKFEKEDVLADAKVIQVKDVHGKTVWILDTDYAYLKKQFIDLKAKDDSDDE
jgi:sRNA-binding protein